MPDIDTLLERLVLAAEKAIRDERDGLAYDQHRLRGLTLEFSISGGGVIRAARVYTERSAKPEPRELRQP